jgi:hypothetical protein
MLNRIQKKEVEEFLSQMSSFSIENFRETIRVGRNVRMDQESAESSMRLSAADFTWLDKRARGEAHPLLTSPDCTNNIGYIIPTIISFAVNAIVYRDRLTPEQHEAFLCSFRQAGVHVPLHPSQFSQIVK